ncbi:hypothetical protein [Streptomyces griseocarneus]|uniref:hypothetical protein n=1 Tax=Streptomyces griseocarneus TaxID=51201 RepID=UPI001CCEFF54|nr:hypothetical protein [Streptomyces griseocarneus]
MSQHPGTTRSAGTPPGRTLVLLPDAPPRGVRVSPAVMITYGRVAGKQQTEQ